MMGIGIAEVLIFLVVMALSLAMPIALVALVVVLLRKRNHSADAMTQLLDENERLRAELSAREAADAADHGSYPR